VTGPTIRVSAPVNALPLPQWVPRHHSSTASWNIHARPGSGTQLLLQRGENVSTVLHALLHQLQEAYGVTPVVTTVSEVVLQGSRGGRPQGCRDGHIELECNMGVTLWSVGR
jgi:hypothetical protein